MFEIVGKLKIVKFDKKGHCCFVYWNWKRFRFETTCWAHTIGDLFGSESERKHLIIGIYE